MSIGYYSRSSNIGDLYFLIKQNDSMKSLLPARDLWKVVDDKILVQRHKGISCTVPYLLHPSDYATFNRIKDLAEKAMFIFEIDHGTHTSFIKHYLSRYTTVFENRWLVYDGILYKIDVDDFNSMVVELCDQSLLSMLLLRCDYAESG